MAGKMKCYQRLQSQHNVRNKCMYKKRNRLLHSENEMDEGNHAVNVSAATINQSNEVTSSLQIVPFSSQSERSRLNTYVFLASGSTISFIDQSRQEKLQVQGNVKTLNIAGIYRTRYL